MENGKNGHCSLRLTSRSADAMWAGLRKRKNADKSLQLLIEADISSQQGIELNNVKSEWKQRQTNWEKDVFL